MLGMTCISIEYAFQYSSYGRSIVMYEASY